MMVVLFRHKQLKEDNYCLFSGQIQFVSFNFIDDLRFSAEWGSSLCFTKGSNKLFVDGNAIESD